ncbi:MAG: hypothetical protein NT154_11260 [Verrucomicrobia bacterium]|nr:hypothetical protein [Verrucomicrobiota bacterium]
MSPQAGELLCTEIVPRIRSLAPGFTPIGAEDREELTAEAVGIAASLLASTEARGKQATPGNIAFFAIKLVRQGRRSGGQSTTDVMSARTRMVARCRVESLDQPIAGEAAGDDMCLHDVLAAGSLDPSQEAAKRLDWAPLVTALDGPIAEVLRCLIEGQDLTTLVPKLKRSRSALQFDKQRLAHLVREHLGEDVLARVQDQPRWRNNIDASRERAACRYERQAA